MSEVLQGKNTISGGEQAAEVKKNTEVNKKIRGLRGMFSALGLVSIAAVPTVNAFDGDRSPWLVPYSPQYSGALSPSSVDTTKKPVLPEGECGFFIPELPSNFSSVKGYDDELSGADIKECLSTRSNINPCVKLCNNGKKNRWGDQEFSGTLYPHHCTQGWHDLRKGDTGKVNIFLDRTFEDSFRPAFPGECPPGLN